jgi:hypothetical protein
MGIHETIGKAVQTKLKALATAQSWIVQYENMPKPVNASLAEMFVTASQQKVVLSTNDNVSEMKEIAGSSEYTHQTSGEATIEIHSPLNVGDTAIRQTADLIENHFRNTQQGDVRFLVPYTDFDIPNTKSHNRADTRIPLEAEESVA